ncbi:hypothetical protein T492DRAFT_1072082 [Pavlovales sp. CCMP2436]|nr:hypothetical protein T492DRAFT_1072082 [Pavlovales sp. CCMP2436]
METSQLAGEVAKALDKVFVDLGDLYIEASHHLAAVEGVCDDAAEAIRCLESERVNARPPSTQSGRDGAAGAGRGAESTRAADRRVGTPVAPARVKPAPVRAKPAASACQRLQLLHAALGKCTSEFGQPVPSLLASGPSPEETSFMRAVARAPNALPIAPDPEAQQGAIGSYGEMCAAHAHGLEESDALRAAVQYALEGSAGSSFAAEQQAVVEQCAQLLVQHGKGMAARADSIELERLQVRARAHRAACLEALSPRYPEGADGAASSAAASGRRLQRRVQSEAWWLPNSAFDGEVIVALPPALPPGLGSAGDDFPLADRAQCGSTRERESRCRALLVAQASAAQLRVEESVSEVALPLLRQLASAPGAGRAALYAFFRLVHCLLCSAGRRMPVFLARDDHGGSP